MMRDEFLELVERYFAGELTTKELAAFREKLATDDVFRREVEAYQKTIRVVRLEGRKALRSRLAEKGRQLDAEKKIPVHRKRWWAGLAVLGAALLAWWFFDKKTETPASFPPVETPATDTIRSTTPALPDTSAQKTPGIEAPEADDAPPSVPPVTNNNSSAGKLFAANFQPYKDDSLEPSVRGEGEATPEEIFLQLYWDSKYPQALAAFDKMEPGSKSKADLQFLRANCLLATGRAKTAIEVLEKLGRTRFQPEGKWLLALAYLKNGETGRAKAQLQQIANDEAAPQRASAQNLLREIE